MPDRVRARSKTRNTEFERNDSSRPRPEDRIHILDEKLLPASMYSSSIKHIPFTGRPVLARNTRSPDRPLPLKMLGVRPTRESCRL